MIWFRLYDDVPYELYITGYPPIKVISATLVGLLAIAGIVFLLVHRIRKSNEGSYLIPPWDSARTAGVLSYVGEYSYKDF